jgi:hypothetical protein
MDQLEQMAPTITSWLSGARYIALAIAAVIVIAFVVWVFVDVAVEGTKRQGAAKTLAQFAGWLFLFVPTFLLGFAVYALFGGYWQTAIASFSLALFVGMLIKVFSG